MGKVLSHENGNQRHRQIAMETLQQQGIQRQETSREGRRPERTVYARTPSGGDELRSWMQDLLRDPVNEYTHFEAGLRGEGLSSSAIRNPAPSQLRSAALTGSRRSASDTV
jgi:hypothetical protein